ncbi:MAG: hypothetical protein AAB075_05990 [Gemmatimonadota bacterium]
MSLAKCLVPFALVATACAGGDSNTDPNPLPSVLLIQGSDMGAKFQNIDILRGTTSVTGAMVTVNGVTMPETNPGRYQGQLPSFLPPGAAVVLQVVAGTLAATGQTTVPQEVTVVAPTSGATFTRGNPISVTWTSSGNPDRFLIGLQWFSNGVGSGHQVSVAGSLRAGSIPTTTVPANATSLELFVFAYGDGTFTGAADPASRMSLRQASVQVPVSFAP